MNEYCIECALVDAGRDRHDILTCEQGRKMETHQVQDAGRGKDQRDERPERQPEAAAELGQLCCPWNETLQCACDARGEPATGA